MTELDDGGRGARRCFKASSCVTFRALPGPPNAGSKQLTLRIGSTTF